MEIGNVTERYRVRYCRDCGEQVRYFYKNRPPTWCKMCSTARRVGRDSSKQRRSVEMFRLLERQKASDIERANATLPAIEERLDRHPSMCGCSECYWRLIYNQPAGVVY